MKFNNEMICNYIKLSVLVTVALAGIMQKFVLGAGYSSETLITSLPMALPYANIISLCFMMVYLFTQ